MKTESESLKGQNIYVHETVDEIVQELEKLKEKCSTQVGELSNEIEKLNESLQDCYI